MRKPVRKRQKDRIERRATEARFEIREDGDDTVALSGYAALFDNEAHGEVIRKGAFDKTLEERDDVRFLVNHDGVPLARTKSGTLELSVDDVGLKAKAPELDLSNPTVQELASAMNREDISQMSFAFNIMRDAMTNVGTDDDPEWLYELLEVKLWDVSVVTYPWYEETSVELNELDQALVDLHAGRELTPERRALLLERVGAKADPEPAPAPTETNDDETEDDLAAALASRRRSLELRKPAA